MAEDELAKKIAEAKEKMFGDLQPSVKIVLLVTGDAEVKSPDPKVEVRKVSS